MEVPSHFIAGSYHALADAVTVGWHPKYEALLSANESQYSGQADDVGEDNGAAD
jgi:hypothetical protein